MARDALVGLKSPKTAAELKACVRKATFEDLSETLEYYNQEYQTRSTATSKYCEENKLAKMDGELKRSRRLISCMRMVNKELSKRISDDQDL